MQRRRETCYTFPCGNVLRDNRENEDVTDDNASTKADEENMAKV